MTRPARHPVPASRQGIRALKAQAAQFHATVRPLMEQLQQQGYGLAAIARELNQRTSPPRGGFWYATTVRNVLNSN